MKLMVTYTGKHNVDISPIKTHIWHEILKCMKLNESTGLSFIYNLNLERKNMQQ